MSHSSVEVTYRPEGAGHRTRTARFDLVRIPDPEAWLTNRLGPLASFGIRRIHGAASGAADLTDLERLGALSARLTTSMQAVLASRRAALDALSIRLEAVNPTARPNAATPNPRQEK